MTEPRKSDSDKLSTGITIGSGEAFMNPEVKELRNKLVDGTNAFLEKLALINQALQPGDGQPIS